MIFENIPTLQHFLQVPKTLAKYCIWSSKVHNTRIEAAANCTVFLRQSSIPPPPQPHVYDTLMSFHDLFSCEMNIV